MDARVAIIGKNAKQARELNGFTQASVSAFLNVDQSLISKFESGSRTLQADLLEKLANLYGFRITDFECENGIPEHRIKTAYRSSGLDDKDLEAIHDIRRIAINTFFMSELMGSGDVE